MTTTPDPAPALTPRDKKTQRLQTRLDVANAALTGAQAKYAADINEANTDVDAIDRQLIECDAQRIDLRSAVEGTRQALETARAIVAQHERTLVELNAKLLDNMHAAAKLNTHHTEAEQARRTKLDQPNRHLAALEHDRNRLAYRLAQHLAREPHTALFVGSAP